MGVHFSSVTTEAMLRILFVALLLFMFLNPSVISHRSHQHIKKQLKDIKQHIFCSLIGTEQRCDRYFFCKWCTRVSPARCIPRFNFGFGLLSEDDPLKNCTSSS